ncbi:hypothetical protein GUITHDRAFT_151614 [Guillardia theta CCMP2712]|uniref:Uncharacterized protein n=1 Tax=Guillardia theta (strain CCMP2712) TaxID=905079 RepID=L1JL61_GUITC|nr:hypothetical protein GUITHDRAFT_151614 [Guillardia theta CCMP2712]EKX49087.1 hypothetical protein GUITHDRAFT_151614 [Guillardia theta CCMP2712]|eukprot:XP_005836067.1 hypothetical protein GUITHDRAFT_151614 [Guillardia theta CCMP2712]
MPGVSTRMLRLQAAKTHSTAISHPPSGTSEESEEHHVLCRTSSAYEPYCVGVATRKYRKCVIGAPHQVGIH